MIPKHRVVFICTGNYYRSRYAELYFNVRVPQGSGWQAISYGFRLNAQNIGPIAPCVLERLRYHQVEMSGDIRMPRQLNAQELTDTDQLIVLNENEHRSLVERQLLARSTQITYWHVADVPVMSTEQALQLIESEVDTLLQSLHQVEGS